MEDSLTIEVVSFDYGTKFGAATVIYGKRFHYRAPTKQAAIDGLKELLRGR
jgi:hypothetical protein